MNRNSPLEQMITLINRLSNEDYIWVINILNKDLLEYCRTGNINPELLQSDINDINTLNNINDFKNTIINKVKNIPDNTIFDLIDLINSHKKNIYLRGHDLSKYKSDKRLLKFSIHYLTKSRYNSEKIELDNEYYKFIYLIYVQQNREYNILNCIEENFSRIITTAPLHFKKNDNIDFYRWAKGYLDNDGDSSNKCTNSKLYTPLTDEDYRITINSIFDILLDSHPDTYKVLKDKISNAWYQKSYRQKNKGKKHYYFLPDKTYECLKILALKKNLTEDRMIDLLINKNYSEECLSKTGNSLYSL